MDEGPVSAAGKSRPSWKLAPPIAEATQGLVVTGFGNLETGRALFLEILAEKAGGGWLGALAEVAPITAAVPPPKDAPAAQARAAAIAFTWTGLARMGLDEAALASFSRPFREGMFQEDRLLPWQTLRDNVALVLTPFGRPAAERGDQYDLLLMDLRMPEIDGPKAASLIRERSESATQMNGNVPLVVFSWSWLLLGAS